MTTVVVSGVGLAAAAAVAGAVGLGLAGAAALGRGRRRRKGGRRRYGRDVTGAGDAEDERAALLRLLEVIREEDVSGCGRRLVCHLAASDRSQLPEEHLAIMDLLE